MGKLTKHAEVLTQLHSLVKKQAEEAQKNISGVPGVETKPESIKEEHETTNKNSVGPENNPQGYSQKPSSDPSEPVASPKTAESLGSEILELIRKHADVQDSVSGEPGKDTNPEKIDEKNETTDKNSVGPEKNTPQTTGEQKESTDDSKPVASAKSAGEMPEALKEHFKKKNDKKEDKSEDHKEDKKAEEEVAELASKVASYELGRQFCAALLKAASEGEQDETQMAKEAGRRDLDLLIAQAAQDLTPADEKQAEAEGAAYFEEILKQAALEQAIEENEELKAKLAEITSKEEAEKKAQAEVAAQVDLADKVANIVLEKLQAAAAQE
jgi:hypothetical protein